MNQTFSGGWKPGDTVRLRPVQQLATSLWGRPGVVADVNGSLERALQPGEVPVRLALVPADRHRDAETVVYLLLPEWIEEAELEHGPTTHQ